MVGPYLGSSAWRASFQLVTTLVPLANAVFQRSPTLTLRSGMSILRLTLWDEDRPRLVGFRDVTIT